LKNQLAGIEYFSKGTVLARMVKCGKPRCRCNTRASRRHGPYYQWTSKAHGKTVNRRLSKEAAAIYQRAAAEYRRLKTILDEMENLSRRVLEKLASEGAHDPPLPNQAADFPG
jgi:hypothetical protein